MLYLIGLNPCGAKFRARILLMRTDGVMVNSEEWFVPWKISHLKKYNIFITIIFNQKNFLGGGNAWQQHMNL